jgi:hypothetical protein
MRKRITLATLLLLLMGLLLAACGDPTATTAPTNSAATATPTTGSATTTAATTTVATTTAKPTTAATTTARPTTTAIATTTPAPITTVVIKPAAQLSAQKVKVGETLTVSGNGYPPNTRLKVLAGRLNTDEIVKVAEPITNAKGEFSADFKTDKFSVNSYLVSVMTQDEKLVVSLKFDVIENTPYNPALVANPRSMLLGSEISLSGSGYPANTSLKLLGGAQNPGVNYGTVKTDTQGKFIHKLKLDKTPDGNAYVAGYWSFVAVTPDDKLSAMVTINLAANQNELSVLTVSEQFFDAVIKNDDAAALKFLSSKQRTRIEKGEQTLGQFLQIARQPNRADVMLYNQAKGYNALAVLQFAGGTKGLYLLVGPDADGSTKIIDVMPQP